MRLRIHRTGFRLSNQPESEFLLRFLRSIHSLLDTLTCFDFAPPSSSTPCTTRGILQQLPSRLMVQYLQYHRQCLLNTTPPPSDPPSRPAWPPMSFAPSAPPQAQPLPTMPPHPIRDQPQGRHGPPTYIHRRHSPLLRIIHPQLPHTFRLRPLRVMKKMTTTPLNPRSTLLRPIFLHTLPPPTPQSGPNDGFLCVSTPVSKDFDHAKDSYLLKHIIHSLLPDCVQQQGTRHA